MNVVGYYDYMSSYKDIIIFFISRFYTSEDFKMRPSGASHFKSALESNPC